MDLTEWLRFTHSTIWYPTFNSLRDYRLTSDTAFLMPLGTSEIWKFKIGAAYEYDPIPQPGRERLDETYYANILLDSGNEVGSSQVPRALPVVWSLRSRGNDEVLRGSPEHHDPASLFAHLSRAARRT
ncbi:MAG: DUF481 domain-containing protein [Phycisphaerales bacterium]|nr:DUF481 domain-containing protein [Phycisphaerales bacterium]